MQQHQTIAGRYDLERLLGVGGVARVYLGRDRMLGRQVAVKIVHSSASGDPSSIERFKREARAAAALNHPNVVAIYDWGQHEDSYYMVMEYVPGPNLKEVIRAGGPLAETRALDIAAQVAGALGAAHEHGLVHRDVKPHNILLDPHGWVKMTDFGIVLGEGLAGLTRTDAIAGTPQYLSPEQAQGLPLDARSDLYSLGVVLYEMVTGREPFTGGTLMDVVLRHIQQAPEPPRNLNPNISPATERIILTAMAKYPAQRFSDAPEMRSAITVASSRARAARSAAESSSSVAAEQATSTMPVVRRQVIPIPIAAARTPVAPIAHSRRWLYGIPAVLAALGVGTVLTYSIVSGALNPSGQGGHAAVATGVHPGSGSHITATPRPNPTIPGARVTATSVRPPAPTTAPTVSSIIKATVAPTVVVHQAPIVANTGTGNPTATVYAFYNSISNHAFSQAASLWSANMLANNSPADAIDKRFNQTTSMQVISARVVRLDPSAGTAVVAVHVKEYLQSPNPPREYVGTWNLVHGSHGWLLDAPYLAPPPTDSQANASN